MGAPHPPQPPGAAHRDHEGVPGGGEDLGALVPAVAPTQLGQESLRLDLRDRCWGSCGGCTPTLSPPVPEHRQRDPWNPPTQVQACIGAGDEEEVRKAVPVSFAAPGGFGAVTQSVTEGGWGWPHRGAGTVPVSSAPGREQPRRAA